VARWLRALCLLLLLLAVAGLATERFVDDVPTLVRDVSAGVLATVLAWGLAVRSGGQAWWAIGLAGALAAATFLTDWRPLVAGAAVGTAVLSGTLAVLATQPAASFRIAIREVLLATLLAAIGALAVVGFVPEVDTTVHVDVERFRYVVLGLALLGAMFLVYRLGAGFHGLGRRGYALAGIAVVMLAVALAYSEALSRWGAPTLIEAFDQVRGAFRDHLGAVPHPISALFGYPALVWGVFMRARRRQGWWVCAFGVAATATASTRLVDPEVPLTTTLLGGVYTLVLGLAIGYLVIRIEQSLTGTHGRRARRDEQAAAHRPEPSRFRPLQ
jgi:hypothetical protein